MNIQAHAQETTYRPTINDQSARVGYTAYGNGFYAALSGWNGNQHVTIAGKGYKTERTAKAACTRWMKELAKENTHIRWVKLS
jgi:hypothetical protein